MTLSLRQIRTLVAGQLRLDIRHPKTGETRSSRAILTPLLYAFSSVILALALAERGASTAELLFAGHSFAAVLAAFSIAGSYDDLMGRPSDHAQIRALPISEHTLYGARLMSVLVFGVMVSLSAVLPLGILGVVQHGWGVGAVVAASIFATMLGVMFAILAAVWLLTLLAPIRAQRFLLSATRALLIALLVVGYQVVATQPTIVVDAPWWIASWVTNALETGSMESLVLLASAAGLLAIFYGAAFPGRYFDLLERSAASEALRIGGRRGVAAPRRLEGLAAANTEVRAGFGLAVAAMHSDRIVRGRVWPAALLAGVFAAFGLWTEGLGSLFVYGAANVLFDPAVQMHLSVMTILLFVSQAAIKALQVSDQPEASWAFDVLPMQSRRALQVGAQQAVLVRVLLPLHAAVAVGLSTAMPVHHALLHAGFWFAGCALMTRLYAITRRNAPLTKRSDQFSAGERFVPLLLAIPAAIAMLLVQIVTFGTPLSALLAVLGLLVFHSALGQAGSIAVPGRLSPGARPAVVREAA